LIREIDQVSLNTLLITPVAPKECELLEGLGRKQFAKSANVAPHRTMLHPSFDSTTVLADAGICGLKKIFTEAC
jgi:hypothetical protein